MKVYHWTPAKTFLLDLGKCRVDPSDSINLILKKLSYVLKTPWTSLYLYYHRDIQSDYVDSVASSFVSQALHTDNNVQFSVLAEKFKVFFGKPIGISDDQYNILDANEAINIVKKKLKNVNSMMIPLAFRYNDIVSYDPSNPRMLSEIKASSLQNYLSLTLRSFDANIQELYVSTWGSERAYLFPYYIPQDDQQKLIQSETNKLIKDLIEVENTIYESTDVSEYTTESYFNFLHIHSKTPSPLDILNAFSALHATKTMPFLKLKTRTNAFYKIHDSYIEPLWENKDLYKKLTQIGSSSASVNLEYIIVRYEFDRLSSATMVLKNDGSFDIRMSFSIKVKVDKTRILSYLDVVNKSIKELNQSIRINLPVIPPSIFETRYESMTIEKMVMYGVSSSKTSEFKFKNFQSLVKSKFYPYFDVLQTEDSNSLILQYKKIDNFAQYDNVTAFITKHYALEKTELVQKLSQNFSITEDEARTEIETWNTTNQVELIKNGTKKYFKPKCDNFVNVIIRWNTVSELRFMVTGLKDVQTFDNVADLLCKLSKMSLTKHKEKSNEFLSLFDERVTQLPQTNNVLTFADIDQEELSDDPEVLQITEDMDDDDDLRELEKEFANEVDDKTQQTKQADDPAPSTNDKRKKAKGELLSKLREADRVLFDYKADKTVKRTDYASMCGIVAQRQPVVVSKEEITKIQKDHPGSIHGFVKTGSSPELAEKNYYICPNIWCPKSRVAITYETYKNAGFKCPNPDIDEEPHLFVKEDDKTQPGLDKKLSRPHYPSFLDMYTHPDRLCLPCCFMTAPKEGSRNQQRQDTCVSNFQTNKEQDRNESIMGNEKYIKGENYSPLENYRYGLLIKEIHGLFGNPLCGDRHDGTGIIKERTPCFLRRGIEHNNQSFMSCVAYLLDYPKGANSIKRRILKHLTVEKYMSLENGRLLKLFIDSSKSISNDEDFQAFKDFLSNESDYVKRFNLNKLLEELEDIDSYDEGNIHSSKEILREFTIWGSFTRFREYISDDSHSKDHRVLIDLINMGESFLNSAKVFFIIIEIDAEGKAYIQCPVRGVKQLDQIGLIIKRGNYYEPLIKLESINKKGLEEEKIFNLTKDLSKDFKTILEFFVKNCKIKADSSSVKNCKAFLESQGYQTRCVVLDYDFKVCGILLKKNLYVPLFQRGDVFDYRKERLIYINEVPFFKCTLQTDEIKNVYKSLQKYTKDHRYRIKYWIKDGQKLSGFALEYQDTFIPVNLRSGTKTYGKFSDDLNIFIGTSLTATESIVKQVNSILNDHPVIKQEIRFLFDRGNPLPADFKKQKLVSLLKTLSLKLDDAGLDLLKKSLHSFMYSSTGDFKTYDDEYLFTYRELRSGKISTILSLKQNPFKFVSDALDDMEIETYVMENNADEALKSLSSAVIKLDEMDIDDVPTKIRKFMKGYQVAKPKTYDRYWLLGLFCQLNDKIDAVILSASLQKKIMEDYTNNKAALQEFIENPSYETLWKKDKRYKMLDSFVESQKMLTYYPSIYEIRLCANLFDVNIVVFGHKTLKNPDGIEVMMPYTGGDKVPYIILRHNYNRFDKRDEFGVFIKNSKQLVFKASELPEEMLQITNMKARGEFEIEVKK